MDRKKIELFRKNARYLGILFELHQKELTNNNGMPLDQFHMLFTINELGTCSMVKLAEELSMTKSKVSRAINNLVKAGFVTREVDSENRRYAILTLTKQGEKLVQHINNKNNVFFESILSEFPKEKGGMFVDNFNVFAKLFKERLTAQAGR
ncbi:putative Transcriptional regulator, MarR family [uncultured Desulfobacterium sp.]|uniref:Putative Transcriptional regulator, MarR family n=1 Tax=uncultured Desulfobacterium sp. TaxID=201089 RepID=A0A445MZF0_9BACT|nr:putative Transcriptional regulator, MarR family [uncultured Desulfobacterium sp.]